MTYLKLQLALDMDSADEAEALARRALPWVDAIEVGTPLLMRCGTEIVARLRALIPPDGPTLLADTKISDEGGRIASICFEQGADGVSVVDGASTATLREVRDLATTMGGEVWIDLLHHNNPIIRARAFMPYADGFILYQTPSGLPPLLVEGLLSIDRPFRLAGGVDLPMIERLRQPQDDPLVLEGVIVGRAITQADDTDAALRAFAQAVGRVESEGDSP